MRYTVEVCVAALETLKEYHEITQDENTVSKSWITLNEW